MFCPADASPGQSALDHRFKHASALRKEASPAGSSIRRAAVTGVFRNTSRRRRPHAMRPFRRENVCWSERKPLAREDFAALLEESFLQHEITEGSVVKGTVVGIEKDVAVIDIGAKTEGRVPLKEFTGPGREGELKVGDEVEVYVDRIENALGEASSRATRRVARRAGSSSRRPSRPTSASPARSSTRSRAATPSISTAPWRSCRARRSISVRCAT